MTLLELVDEVFEKTHVDRVEIYSKVQAAWPDGRAYFTPTQCALLERALRGATPPSPLSAPLKPD